LYKLPAGKNKEVQKFIDEKGAENLLYADFIAG
jgi:hypothetical protein